MLEIGRESVYGEAADVVLAEAADDLIAEAMGGELGTSEAGDERRDDAPEAIMARRGGDLVIAVAGTDLVATAEGALLWPEEQLAGRRRPASRKGLVLGRAGASSCRPTTPPRRSRGSPR